MLALLLALSRVCGIPNHNDSSSSGLQVGKEKAVSKKCFTRESSGHHKVPLVGRAFSQKGKAKVVTEPAHLVAESKSDGHASSQLDQTRWKHWWYHKKSVNAKRHWKVNSRPKRKWFGNGRANLKGWQKSYCKINT